MFKNIRHIFNTCDTKFGINNYICAGERIFFLTANHKNDDTCKFQRFKALQPICKALFFPFVNNLQFFKA
jgi:hypothetical protein